ncbi:putative cytochrome C3 [Desulfosarcina cetonica]|uniref:cytochrome c3 family protein n=1 Tax=Desulfosarcina cetonica TaxID=90730 RepID=UPI0006CF9D1E|nr:cytochrome c3 family protein [Desulfosarcina cetonica]VTR69976.1 putative cytochrome C3 [Desulfosarcina cetonica]
MKRFVSGIGTMVILLVGAVAICAAAANRGPADMQLFGGNQGKVPFSHARHQDRLGDCNVCHSVFPQTHASIEKMKAAGSLKPKQVMNTQCIKCHRQEKKAGNPHGPLTCRTCHVK